MTFDSAAGYWTTGYVYALPPQGGPVDVSLAWQSTTGGKQTYSKIQRVYSGSDDASGPVKDLALSTATTTLGAPYTLSAGTHTITARVGLEGSLDLTNAAQTTMLRLTGGSQTSAIACDGPGAAEFRSAIINGCQTPYQLNSAGVCPDPAPPFGARGLCPDQDRDDGRADAAGPRRTLLRVPCEQLAQLRRRERPEGGAAVDHGLLRAGRERRDRRARHQLRGLLHHRLDRLEVRQQRA